MLRNSIPSFEAPIDPPSSHANSLGLDIVPFVEDESIFDFTKVGLIQNCLRFSVLYSRLSSYLILILDDSVHGYTSIRMSIFPRFTTTDELDVYYSNGNYPEVYYSWGRHMQSI